MSNYVFDELNNIVLREAKKAFSVPDAKTLEEIVEKADVMEYDKKDLVSVIKTLKEEDITETVHAIQYLRYIVTVKHYNLFDQRPTAIGIYNDQLDGVIDKYNELYMKYCNNNRDMNTLVMGLKECIIPIIEADAITLDNMRGLAEDTYMTANWLDTLYSLLACPPYQVANACAEMLVLTKRLIICRAENVL